MKKLVSAVAVLGLIAAFPVFAAKQDAESLIAQCTKEAQEKGVQDIDAYVNDCLDQKVQYEKDE